jgi:hypothetical protein
MATPEPTYPEDRTVQAITSYYNFLQNLYLDLGTVIYPPPEGWPSITAESLAPLHKNDTVVSLLRHIPYFAQPSSHNDQYCIARKTWPIQYNNPKIQALASNPDKKWMLQPVIDREVPAHVICLANGVRDSYYVLLDTERGVAIWGNPDGGNRHAKDQGRELNVKGLDPDGPDWWKGQPTFEIEAFFEMLKDRFRSLEWMPHPFGAQDVWEDEGIEDDGQTEALRGIMRDAGWTGQGDGKGWDREGAMRKMEEREDEWM